MAAMDIKDITRKRNTISGKIRSIRKEADDHATAPLSVDLVEIHLQSLQCYIQEANQLHNQIIEECTDDSLIDAHIDMLVAHEKSANEAKALLMAIKANLQPKVSPAIIAKTAELRRKRDGIYATMQAMQTRVNDHANNPLSLEHAECELGDLVQLKSTSDTVMFELLSLISSPQVASETANQQKLTTIAREMQAALNLIIKAALPNSASTGRHANANVNGHIKLPVISLPTFEGKYENWTTFKDLFTATVDDNAALSGAQKLQYLIASLKGEAAALVKSVQITDANYAQAWATVNDRYNNVREIITSVLNRFYDQPYVTTESGPALQQLLDTTAECRRSLDVLGRPVDAWDDIFVHQTVRKLDAETRRRWLMSLKRNQLPTFKQLSEFLDQTVRSLASDGANAQSSKSYSNAQRQSKFNPQSGGKKVSSNHGSTRAKCPICSGDHLIYTCDKFLSLSVPERNNQIKKLSLCYNCLRSGHGIRECKSDKSCKQCKGRHNSLLHEDKKSNDDNQTKEVLQSLVAYGNSQVLLATALVLAKDKFGDDKECRMLIDSGSQASFISERCASYLGLKRSHSNVIITGIANSGETSARGQVKLTLGSQHNKCKIQINALILSKVTSPQPSFKCIPGKWDHIKGLDLADPSYNKSSHIDILLGADYAASIMRDGKRQGQVNTPVAQNTIFGWILSGRVSCNPQRTIQVNYCETDQILRKFWELEEMPAIKHLTADEKQCEAHFATTHSRTNEGRYVVEFPMNSKIDNLGQSRQAAVKRLQQVEKRLASNPEIKEQYNKFMQEFIDLNHMERIPPEDLHQPLGKFFYLPHHFVLKDSTSTKLRVVFDGSAKSSTGLSLNECTLVGETVQDDLFALLLRFRSHVIALKADIAKMYRQFELAPEHQHYQRILWRNSPDEPIVDYRITRVTYGTAPAPFMATRCLKQLALDEREQFPIAAPVLEKDFYVDDLMSGTQSANQAINLQQQLTNLLKCGGMELVKWASNSQEVLNSIPAENREVTKSVSLDPENQDGVIKALGVNWHPASDTFSFQIHQPKQYSRLTKRVVLSELSKVFDPIGFLSPVTIIAKLLFQDLWKLQLEWDQELDDESMQKWADYVSQLQAVSEISIPRCLIQSITVSKELHGFCDGSEKAYAAVVYLRCKQSDGSFTVRMITSKTKVAPVKKVSIPRLELCGAFILSKLISKVKHALQIDDPIITWTDSTIVLDWLSKCPSKLQTFEANRVAEIQRLVPRPSWHHVKSEDNPSDCATRGLSANQLKDFSLWWNGPEWLSKNDYQSHNWDPCKIPIGTCLIASAEHWDPFKNSVGTSHVISLQVSTKTESSESTIWNKFSALRKVNRAAAYWLRLINYLKSKSDLVKGELTCEELQTALSVLIKQVQASEFSSETKCLQQKKPVEGKSKLFHLSAYLDKEGMIRVGGRLQNSNVPEVQKHPLVLPHHHKLTTLIIQHYHQANLHAGPQLLLSTIQQRYWIIRAKDEISKFTKNCVTCRRHKAATAQQFMGNLPVHRVNPGRPFQFSGLDYAGPFMLRASGRGKTRLKYYVCVFVCLATKAVHLETVADLTSESFIATLKCFVARRGLCTDLFSDCGTNFVGADQELQKFLKSTTQNNLVRNHLAEDGIKWHFNPPGAPHQGGLWEAVVKSMKFHLKRVMGTAALNVEEFRTLLCQIEACLNSRPLCPISNDPSDLSPLTPGHFLIGAPLRSIPEPDLTDLKMNRLSRWQLTQQLLQHFWKRWQTEYLNTLQQRYRWNTTQENLKAGDLVIIKDDNQPPTKWKLGRIMETHPGADNLVRVVTVRTSNGEIKRPVTKLCILLKEDDQLKSEPEMTTDEV